MSPAPSHGRNDSFGDFVTADMSERPIIDLRGVEAKLDSQRTTTETGSANQTATGDRDQIPMDLGDQSWSAAIGRTISSITSIPQHFMQGTGSLINSDVPQDTQRAGGPAARIPRDPTVRTTPIPVTLRDRREDTDVVIDEWHASQIHTAVPRRLRLGRNWRLIYSLDQHGSSLATLYNRVAASKNQHRRKGANEQWLLGSSEVARGAVLGSTFSGATGPLSDFGFVVAIRDMRGNVFGAYVNEQLRPCQHYYGNGECFLWKTVTGDDKALEVYRWTGKNDYMILTESSFLSVGGGDGKYGLWIDSTLDTGQSSWCPAYDNTVLCDDVVYAQHTDDTCPGKFQCLGVEVWAIGDQ